LNDGIQGVGVKRLADAGRTGWQLRAWTGLVVTDYGYDLILYQCHQSGGID